MRHLNELAAQKPDVVLEVVVVMNGSSVEFSSLHPGVNDMSSIAISPNMLVPIFPSMMTWNGSVALIGILLLSQ